MITSPDVILSSEMRIHPLRIDMIFSRFVILDRELFWPVEKFFHRSRIFYWSKIFLAGWEFFTGRECFCHLSTFFGQSRIFFAGQEFFHWLRICRPAKNFLGWPRIFFTGQEFFWLVKNFFGHSRIFSLVENILPVEKKSSRPITKFSTSQKNSRPTRTNLERSISVLKGWIFILLNGMASGPVILKTGC